MSAPYGHIAVAVDHSEESLSALRLAGQLSAGEARLSVLHVVAPVPAYHALGGQVIPVSPGAHDAAKLWLTGIASEYPGSEPVLIDGGHVGDEIIRWSDANGADLIVVAPHQGMLTRALVGSAAGFVLQRASVPVLVVRQTHRGAP